MSISTSLPQSENFHVTTYGEIITLEAQDRELWDKELIAQGHHHLEQASDTKEISEYMLQASIAACHCFSPRFDDTNWERILFLYDHLLKIKPSNVIKLNRDIEISDPTFNYYLLYAVKAQLLCDSGKTEQAVTHFEQALKLTNNELERKHIQLKIQDIIEHSSQ